MNEDRIRELVSQMTLEEKCGLCSGLDFWHTKPVQRLGVPSAMVTDGPHGLRKEAPAGGTFSKSLPATCFPSGAGLAASWDRDLLERVGSALGEEAKAEEVAVVLGPATNMKRSPLCGRNFEYFSEDPLLAGELAASHIKGVQSKGVGTSIKHFAVNNQESCRLVVDAVVDERALREIYLKPFEIAVKKSRPWTVMCAYNKVNGEYCSQNRRLLTDILRTEWGFDGLVMTDWGACDDRVRGLAAGQDLEMPGNGGLNDRKIAKAVRRGELDEAVLDQAAARVLRLAFRAIEGNQEPVGFDKALHHAEARKIAADCMVLLKNDGVLPLPDCGSVAVIGAFARTPRYQGGGSSHIEPTRLDDAVEELARALPGAEVAYAPGYDPNSNRVDPALIAEAQELAAKSDLAIVFVGLTELIESEGYDRENLALPESHDALVEAVLQVQKNAVVVLSNGSPILLPWLGGARAVLEGYLGGQAWGGAVADVLSGAVNPSGKLPETFPKRLEDSPAFLDFPGEPTRVEYREGVFVGYRHYDSRAIEPLFPFGFGLSYTSFEYSDLRLDRTAVGSDGRLGVSFTLKNVGTRRGKETVQLYVERPGSKVVRPLRELRAFAKLELGPGESTTVRFELEASAFSHWSMVEGGWTIEEGKAEICVGASSRDLRLRAGAAVAGTPRTRPYDANSTASELEADPRGASSADTVKRAFLANFAASLEPGSVQREMMVRMANDMPLRAVVQMSGGRFTEEDMDKVLRQMNGA